MNTSVWSSSKSIQLSKVLTLLFALALVVVDIFAIPIRNLAIVELFCYNKGLFAAELLLGNLYLCSIPGYILLYNLYCLLQNIVNGCVFIPQNAACLRRVSWCCFVAAFFCGVVAFVWLSHAVVAIAAAFVGMIVRVVKNVLEQAILMKDELDFTV